ncbi:hypothetical protein EDD22DRAFT_911379 [Suillus occidentalis]|nr:hypothetical protein EDD22DRAFT_911379 [Suillus occidentalis]
MAATTSIQFLSLLQGSTDAVIAMYSNTIHVVRASASHRIGMPCPSPTLNSNWLLGIKLNTKDDALRLTTAFAINVDWNVQSGWAQLVGQRWAGFCESCQLVTVCLSMSSSTRRDD